MGRGVLVGAVHAWKRGNLVSRFYLLPPRPLLGDELADFLGGWLPGLDWDADTRLNLCEALKAAATCRPDVFVVFREELPTDMPIGDALCDVFGAEVGDEVVEVRSLRPGEQTTRCWRILPFRSSARSAA